MSIEGIIPIYKNIKTIFLIPGEEGAYVAWKLTLVMSHNVICDVLQSHFAWCHNKYKSAFQDGYDG